MDLRTSLIVGAILLAFVSWVTALSMPRRPDFTRAFTLLAGLNVAAAITFTAVFVYDDPDIGPGFNFWAVPIAIFLVAFGASVLARGSAKQLGKAYDANGRELVVSPAPTGSADSHRDLLGPRTNAYLDALARSSGDEGNGLDMEWLSQFRFTGTGVGFLTHIHDTEQEVGCVVSTPYRGMTLAELVNVANRHQCQESRSVAA